MKRLLLLFLLGACAFGSLPIEEVDDIPELPDYEVHVAPIMDFYCTACHGAGNLFAGDVSLTSEAEALNFCNEIDNQVFGIRAMPPGGARRLTAREEVILRRWLDNGKCEDGETLCNEQADCAGIGGGFCVLNCQ